MSCRSTYRLAAWLLIALLAIVAGVREGLHLIPGLGHGIIVGDQVLLLGEEHEGPWVDSAPRCGCLVAPVRDTLLVLDEDDCPICNLLGMKLAPGATGLMLLLELQTEKTPFAFVHAEAFVPAAYQARGPPTA